MQLPIGILIYWVKRFEENHAVISGMWYYKEMYVPSTIEEKKKALQDLKEKRCTVLNIEGNYEQIKDILSRGDRFIEAGNRELSDFFGLLADLENLPVEKAYLFDDVYNIKGTALMVDSMIEVDETMDNILSLLKRRQPVNVTISENWSFTGDLEKAFNGL